MSKKRAKKVFWLVVQPGFTHEIFYKKKDAMAYIKAPRRFSLTKPELWRNEATFIQRVLK